MGTRDMNDPRFFDDRNLDSIGEPARFSDYGPGPNESLDYAKSASSFVRNGFAAAPSVVTDSFVETAGSTGSSDAVDRLADLVLDRVMRKLQDM